MFSASCTTLSKQKARTVDGASNTLNLDDGKGAYHTQTYRNLFGKRGHTEEQVSLKISSALQQLFYSDAALQRINFPAGSNGNGAFGYILDVNTMISEVRECCTE